MGRFISVARWTVRLHLMIPSSTNERNFLWCRVWLWRKSPKAFEGIAFLVSTLTVLSFSSEPTAIIPEDARSILKATWTIMQESLQHSSGMLLSLNGGTYFFMDIPRSSRSAGKVISCKSSVTDGSRLTVFITQRCITRQASLVTSAIAHGVRHSYKLAYLICWPRLQRKAEQRTLW